MSDKALDLLNSHKFIDGRLISSDVQRVVDSIREYSDELDVKWIPPEIRQEGDAAFAIIHNPPMQPPYVLFYVKTEEKMTPAVLQRIIANDQRNGQHKLSEFEAWEATQRLIERQKFLDAMEEKQDIVKHVIETNRNLYKVNDDLIIDGQRGNVARQKRRVHLGPTGKRGKF